MSESRLRHNSSLSPSLHFPFLTSIIALVWSSVQHALTFVGIARILVMSLMMRRKSRYYAGKKDPTLEKQSTKAQVEATCPICQELIGSRTPEGIVEGWSILPCGHRFGNHCIKRYLNIVADDRPSCPVCRQVAYHICGHPVLPAQLKSDDGSAGPKIVEASALLVQEMRFSNCAYCQKQKASSGLRRARAPSKWRAAVGWLRYLRFNPKRLLRRQRRSLPSVLPPTYDLTPQPRGLFDGHGPWVDPFPRTRDPAWESWWHKQAPCGV
ncbi:hypothetical protein B0H63DRAFT_486320 [Podospora didyma]|uniref:RING-type domain-containing protein n=1 Tax=Podospora didyma TaxID=330526 RepID=A0AAE0K4V1_9PEZI|nr:hypothetical protein B0H63DRAFT_486320 [Podospora didyma]